MCPGLLADFLINYTQYNWVYSSPVLKQSDLGENLLKLCKLCERKLVLNWEDQLVESICPRSERVWCIYPISVYSEINIGKPLSFQVGLDSFPCCGSQEQIKGDLKCSFLSSPLSLLHRELALTGWHSSKEGEFDFFWCLWKCCCFFLNRNLRSLRDEQFNAHGHTLHWWFI